MEKRSNQKTLNLMRMLLAFALYKKDGIDAVAETFVELMPFVEENKSLSNKQLREKLFHQRKEDF